MPRHIARGNVRRTRIRSRVEHVFAAQKRRFDLVIRTIGKARATAKLALANLAYNFSRLESGQRGPRDGDQIRFAKHLSGRTINYEKRRVCSQLKEAFVRPIRRLGGKEFPNLSRDMGIDE